MGKLFVAMNEKIMERVLVIDDDRFLQKIVRNTLKESYEVHAADNGDQGLLEAKKWHPNAILLDVEMPGMNGFEVCDALKLDELTANIPVIFISASSSLRERLMSYEVGAEDYVVKPFEKEILKAKVDHAVLEHSKQQALSTQSDLAQKTAQDAIMSSAELGKAIRFVSSTYILPTVDMLAPSVFKVMSDLGLKTSMALYGADSIRYYNFTGGDISPLEKELLDMMRDQGRFCDFGSRTVCNFSHVSLLIKNMPLENMEKYGRIKDTVPFILNAVDEKMRALNTQKVILDQAESLARSTEAVQATLLSITDSASKTHEGITQVMRSLTDDFEARLPSMGLEDDQEKYIVDRVDLAFSESLACLSEGENLKESLGGVVRLLSHLVNQQNDIVASSDQGVPSTEDGDQEDFSNDVELF